MDSPAITRHLDDACLSVALVTLYPGFTGGVYAFEPPNVAHGTWLPIDAEPLPGEVGVRVPAMPAQDFELRKARCRILLEDGLARRLSPERSL